VVEAEILNGGRENLVRPIPVVFIPSSSKKLLKEMGDQVMTVFLEPFIRELVSSFIDGFDVIYNFPSEIISPAITPAIETGSSKLRVMLMYWTGDHPAQCKVAGLKLSGYSACRRCLMAEKISGNQVLYHDNRRQAQYPPPVRTIESIYLEANELRRTGCTTRQNNVTTYSKLWRLYDLYGFNLSVDVVYDSMHILPLNIFKSFVDHMIHLGRAEDLDTAINEITEYRPKELGARWPRDCSKRISYWKAEEYQLFIQWCLPYCMEKLNIQKTDRLYGIGQILTEIARLFFSHTRTYGWTQDSISIARKLLSAWRVHWEEYVGPSNSVLKHVAGGCELLIYELFSYYIQ
jgi:hypothetical protein